MAVSLREFRDRRASSPSPLGITSSGAAGSRAQPPRPWAAQASSTRFPIDRSSIALRRSAAVRRDAHRALTHCRTGRWWARRSCRRPACCCKSRSTRVPGWGGAALAQSGLRSHGSHGAGRGLVASRAWRSSACPRRARFLEDRLSRHLHRTSSPPRSQPKHSCEPAVGKFSGSPADLGQTDIERNPET